MTNICILGAEPAVPDTPTLATLVRGSNNATTDLQRLIEGNLLSRGTQELAQLGRGTIWDDDTCSRT